MDTFSFSRILSFGKFKENNNFKQMAKFPIKGADGVAPPDEGLCLNDQQRNSGKWSLKNHMSMGEKNDFKYVTKPSFPSPNSEPKRS